MSAFLFCTVIALLGWRLLEAYLMVVIGMDSHAALHCFCGRQVVVGTGLMQWTAEEGPEGTNLRIQPSVLCLPRDLACMLCSMKMSQRQPSEGLRCSIVHHGGVLESHRNMLREAPPCQGMQELWQRKLADALPQICISMYTLLLVLDGAKRAPALLLRVCSCLQSDSSCWV